MVFTVFQRQVGAFVCLFGFSLYAYEAYHHPPKFVTKALNRELDQIEKEDKEGNTAV